MEIFELSSSESSTSLIFLALWNFQSGRGQVLFLLVFNVQRYINIFHSVWGPCYGGGRGGNLGFAFSEHVVRSAFALMNFFSIHSLLFSICTSNHVGSYGTQVRFPDPCREHGRAQGPDPHPRQFPRVA